ncbi:MAG: hypothetical protein MJY50_04970 [Bacteroidales bacterium]|nr:hypothetical protein [Bacteroidales bacterium]
MKRLTALLILLTALLASCSDGRDGADASQYTEFTQSCFALGVYDLSRPDNPSILMKYKSVEDQLAYGFSSGLRQFRIQNLTQGYAKIFGITPVYVEEGAECTLTVSSIGDAPLPSIDGTYRVTVRRHMYGRLWLTDNNGKLGFLIVAE